MENTANKEITEWNNVLKKDNHYSIDDWIKTILNINIMYSIIEYRSKLLKQQNPKENTVDNICSFIKNNNKKELKNILELMFLEPIEISILSDIKNLMQNKNIVLNMVNLHRNKKDLRIIRILDQALM